MYRLITVLLASASVALASPTVFSVHDDLLAFPQYEVVFSDDFISDIDANVIIDRSSSTIQDPPQTSNTKSIESQHSYNSEGANINEFDPAHETYEVMNLAGEEYLCVIPIVDPPIKNETSEAEAREAEQKELARATDRGWELLQDLQGNCLYFVSGWWSYSFCYNAEIKQFHQLPPQPGKPQLPPQPDPNTKEFVLGRAKVTHSKEDEWGNQIEAHKGHKHREPPKTELQVKGDTRYLVQKMDGGTICDLTGKPRRIEVQYHCNPHLTDRIGYIKEVTTCSYLMVVYTPRLCNDVAFLPPKETKANEITCRAIVPSSDLSYRIQLRALETSLEATADTVDKPVNIGGVIVGAGKWAGKEGQRMPIPPNFGQDEYGNKGRTEVIARAKSKAEGGQVEVVSDSELQKMDLDPEMVQELRREVQGMAEGKGWQIKVVDAPGQVREIFGIVDEDDDDVDTDADLNAKENGKTTKDKSSGDTNEEGSEEIYKDEL